MAEITQQATLAPSKEPLEGDLSRHSFGDSLREKAAVFLLAGLAFLSPKASAQTSSGAEKPQEGSIEKVINDSEGQGLAKPNTVTYTIKEGDTLWGIAQRLLGKGERWDEIARLNPDINPKALKVGSKIKVPLKIQSHTIKQKEDCFNWALGIVLRQEGGLNRNPLDPGNRGGGATNFGITQQTYNMWRDRLRLPHQDVSKITKDEAREIYKTLFWEKTGCGEISKYSPGLGLLYFDCCVNNGPSNASKWLQQALCAVGKNVKVDGRVGPKTLNALEGCSNSELANIVPCISRQRMSIARSPFYRKNFSGLSRRYKEIESLALGSISSLPNQEKGNNTKVDNQISGELKILGDAVKSGRYIRLSREKSREALALQRLLNSIGYTLKEDGIPGPKTTEALRDFQRQNGLKPDGIFGPKSLERLHAIAATTKK